MRCEVWGILVSPVSGMMWTNLTVILFIEWCWAIWAYWVASSGSVQHRRHQLAQGHVTDSQHEIANSIFNLIQRTGSELLICTDWLPAVSPRAGNQKYFSCLSQSCPAFLWPAEGRRREVEQNLFTLSTVRVCECVPSVSAHNLPSWQWREALVVDAS